MLHARNDYNARIQDSDNIIPQDEPVFLLRAQDIFAPTMLKIYVALIQQSTSPDENIIRNTENHIEAMIQWQRNNKCQHPDMNDGDSVY
jgi:hypothetical protein